MKILFLYSEYVSYLDGLMNALVKNYGAIVQVVSWDKNLLKPFNIPEIPGVIFHKRSKYSVIELTALIEDFNPDLVYISGWMDHGYLQAVRKARNRKLFTTICGFDDNWFGTIRQRIGAIYFRFFMRKYFDKAWVAGARQYHYARQFGYSDADIVFNMLSCDTDRFNCKSIPDFKSDTRQRKFFYVGNFRDVKGTDLLADAYGLYRSEMSGSCELVCIGQGPLKSRLDDVVGIKVLPFMSATELIEKTASFDIFVFPSRKDQWGIALHEFCLLGFPVISSLGTGSTERFLINGYNGLMFKQGDHVDLAKKMKLFEMMPIEKLHAYSKRSKQIGQVITSEISAASLVSVVNSSSRTWEMA